MRKKKGKLKKVMAAALAAVMIAGTVSVPSHAAPPKVEIDETVYVNMDHYGEVNDISVVKGCFLNGNTTIEDYGNYDEIINMSDRTQPVVEGDKVTWNLEGSEKQYFYYEGKSEDLKEKVPWDFDISYRLNGVEKRGEDLGGAEGLVTTLIHVTPKEDIPDYYKNNMVLVCGTLVDMKNTLSIEAPGAQLQTLGTEKAALFMALPGEESEFRIDVGTNRYESMGVFFLVVPVTFDSLEVVNDVRDVRDTVEDSVDAMDLAFDAVLDNIDGMKGDLESVEQGLQKAETAHRIYDKNREIMEADADAAIASLENTVTYLKIINTQTEADQANLDETIDRLSGMMRSVQGLSNFGQSMSTNLSDLGNGLGQLNSIAEGTIDQEKMEQLQQIAGMQGGPTVAQAAEAAIMTEEAASATAKQVNAMGMLPDPISGDLVLEIWKGNAPADVPAQLVGVINGTVKEKAKEEAIRQMGYDPSTAGSVRIADPSGADVGLKSALTNYMSTLDKVGAEAGDTGKSLITDSRELMEQANAAMGTVDNIAGYAGSLADWTEDQVREDVQTLITQLTDLVDATQVTLAATQAALSSMRNTMELTEDTLSSSLTLTINGLTGMAHSGAGIADSVDVMRDAKNTIKDAVESELDKAEAEHNFLDMDVTAQFPSFTSEKNGSPNSIQIILRTAEISADDEADHVTDIEVPEEDIGVWGRFKNVFVNLWNKIVGIFH